MQITVLKEQDPNEARVALVPESVKKLVGQGAIVAVEQGAGLNASINDNEYEAAGAILFSERDRFLKTATVLLAVNRPTDTDLDCLESGSVVIAFLRPLDEPSKMEHFIARSLTAFPIELIPRTTRAQSMDGLSSMATIVGYKAVLVAAERMPRMFPMLTTAAGTVPPAKVLILGAGVAGLQAIATARRLGAIVEGFDVRPAAGEAVRSLGAKFLEVDMGGAQAEDVGGYAREVTAEVMERSRELIVRQAALSDCIITSAQVPGKRAPLLVTEQAVAGMKRGSVIVDLAGANGGNCARTLPGKEVDVDGVKVISPLNLPATVPFHASQLYSRNLTSFLSILIKEGQLNLDFNDDIIGPTCAVHAGQAVESRLKAALSAAE